MKRSSPPEMTVVLGAPDGFEAVRRTVSHLAAQTVSKELELLLVVRDSVHIDLNDPAVLDATIGLGSVRVVTSTRSGSGGAARAAGARAAQASVVAFAEDHSFPAPDWAAALIAAHRADWAAVGPAIRNANPGTIVSWADLFIGYGPWLAPGRAGVRDYLPGHNSAYKRERLLEYGDSLDDMMEAETVLHWDLRKRGFRLYFEPAATTAHTNFGIWSSWFSAMLMNGRLFAASRGLHWPVARRASFAVASPLIPVVRFVRTIRNVLASGTHWTLVARAAPALAVGVAMDGLGQMLGYAFGLGNARQRCASFEANRDQHVPAAERRAPAVRGMAGVSAA